MMADKRKGKNKKIKNEPIKPSKEEYAVAKYLRFNVPVKEAKLIRMTVQYFIASKAVDHLLESKWSSKNTDKPLFSNRQQCVDYCNRLLEHGMFHRAAKEERKKKDDKKSKDEKLKKEKRSKKMLKDKEESDNKDTNEGDLEKEDTEKEDMKKEDTKKDDAKKDEDKTKKKKDRKLKLKMHDDQVFVDKDEIYVWIYDPVPLKTFIIGLLLVLGAIAVCLFPLWPPEVRLGVYYLSLAAIGFLGVIIGLVIIRFILFCMVWFLTLGKHHFWFLPNLTEDVGFFDSFKPLYKHTVAEPSKTKAIQDKESKEEGEAETEQQLMESQGDEDKSKAPAVDDKSSTGEDDENGYDIVDPDELPTEESLVAGDDDDEDEVGEQTEQREGEDKKNV